MNFFINPPSRIVPAPAQTIHNSTPSKMSPLRIHGAKQSAKKPSPPEEIESLRAWAVRIVHKIYDFSFMIGYHINVFSPCVCLHSPAVDYIFCIRLTYRLTAAAVAAASIRLVLSLGQDVAEKRKEYCKGDTMRTALPNAVFSRGILDKLLQKQPKNKRAAIRLMHSIHEAFSK